MGVMGHKTGGSLNVFPSFFDQITTGALFDIGAMASDFGGVDDDYTCKANAKSKASRRDYVIANNRAKNLIHTMKVDHNAGFLVHDVITVTFKENAPKNTRDIVVMPTPIKNIFNDKCIESYGDINNKCYQDRITKAEEKEPGKYNCKVELDYSEICDDFDNLIEQPGPIRPKTNVHDDKMIDRNQQQHHDRQQQIIEDDRALSITPPQKTSAVNSAASPHG